MRPLDYLEPIALHTAGESLRSVVASFEAGIPVAIADQASGWRLLRPADAAAFPLTRQLCDLPSRQLPTVRVDAELDLGKLTTHETWGATKGRTLVGRLETARVLGALAVTTRADSERELAAEARSRLMPKMLHDLSNALSIVGLASNDPEAAQQALQHSMDLVGHMRLLYSHQPATSDTLIRLDTFLGKVAPMLRSAARPALLTVQSCDESTVRGERWRIETILLNLVLNASEVASSVAIAARSTRGTLELTVTDDGPGLSDAELSGTGTSTTLRGHGLASVRRQVAILGGRVKFQRAEGGGTRVVIRLAQPSE